MEATDNRKVILFYAAEIGAMSTRCMRFAQQLEQYELPYTAEKLRAVQAELESIARRLEDR